jgi:hypothetical protein
MHDGDTQTAARLKHARRLAHSGREIVDVLKRHVSDDAVELLLPERKPRRVGDDDFERRVRRSCSGDHRRGDVHCEDLVTETLQIARDAALAAAEVERSPTRRRDKLQEGVPVELPVAVVIGLTRPCDPFARMCLPRLGETRGVATRPS